MLCFGLRGRGTWLYFSCCSTVGAWTQTAETVYECCMSWLLWPWSSCVRETESFSLPHVVHVCRPTIKISQPFFNFFFFNFHHNKGWGSSGKILFSKSSTIKHQRLFIYRRRVSFQYGTTALMVASYSGHYECVKELIMQGADINYQREVWWGNNWVAHRHNIRL